MPVLLVSALVSDRVAVAQWGLTRVVAGLLRMLCIKTTLPLAAELGHDTFHLQLLTHACGVHAFSTTGANANPKRLHRPA